MVLARVLVIASVAFGPFFPSRVKGSLLSNGYAAEERLYLLSHSLPFISSVGEADTNNKLSRGNMNRVEVLASW
ncbi:uncharacterized protein EDB91DRAFT_1107918 [Suillus paluster]|uniref:uncharacterized protein n=1 Tax=Suillus paluster TaxID=48578 RepID=UPI001B88162E|nr:uncharacterized protein EDB91DRAFT_1107918 [Suillus paluster]KAG1750523.1 hypothetical protein EDB91DRAFT_1107918 [Suillus paluster]